MKWYNKAGECLACLGETAQDSNDDRFNPYCCFCSKTALEEWIEHLEHFRDAGYPKSYEESDREDELVKWLDLMHHENTNSAVGPETYDNVAGAWHSSMWDIIYIVDCNLSNGITREVFEEYLEAIKRCLEEYDPKDNGWMGPDDDDEDEDEDDGEVDENKDDDDEDEEQRLKELQDQETSRQQAYAAGPEPIAHLSDDSDCEE